MPTITEIDPRPANAACARTLAGRADIDVALDSVPRDQMRGAADAIAFHARYDLADKADSHRPIGAAGEWFDLLVETRSEALGAARLPGVAANLSAYRLNGDQTRSWAFAAFCGNFALNCPAPLWQAMLNLAALLGDPGAFVIAARRISLELAGVGETVVRIASEEPAIPSRDEQEASDNDEVADEGQPQAPAEAESSEDSLPGTQPPLLPDVICSDYRVWIDRYDRVVHARQLAPAAELDRLRARLDTELMPYRQLVARMAHQLQRLLLARQRRYWSLDQDDGQLDASRLARLIAAPGRPQVFRVEEESPFPLTCITLLLDNSGSMRGHPITVAALTADILARALERCGIQVEILGYTTAGWLDNPATQAWEQGGRPSDPGRLNALRHIVYKSMDTPWRRARRDLGLLLQDGLLKENIDGEALAWAAERLLRRTESRRLLIVVSDGAPMDKATLGANPRGYLDRHLHEVIAWLEKSTDIELRAIGIGHQVGRYYRHAIQLRNVDALGTVLMKRLGEWLGGSYV